MREWDLPGYQSDRSRKRNIKNDPARVVLSALVAIYSQDIGKFILATEPRKGASLCNVFEKQEVTSLGSAYGRSSGHLAQSLKIDFVMQTGTT